MEKFLVIGPDGPEDGWKDYEAAEKSAKLSADSERGADIGIYQLVAIVKAETKFEVKEVA